MRVFVILLLLLAFAAPPVAAADIVMDQVKRLLSRPEWVGRIVRDAHSPNVTEHKVAKLLQNFEMVWDELFPAEQRRILGLLIDHISVHPHKLQIKYRPLGMASLMHEIMPDLTLMGRAPSTEEFLTVEVPVQFKQRGSRKHILTPDGRDVVSSQAPKYETNMIRALIRGHQFLEILDHHPELSTKTLAEKEKLDPSYVAKFVRMTQLAPDIVTAILNGRQPKSLSLSQLLRTFPDSWAEQRQYFGFGAPQLA